MNMMKFETPKYAKKVMRVFVEDQMEKGSKKDKEKVVLDAHGRIFGGDYEKRKEITEILKGESRALCEKIMKLMGITWEDEENMSIFWGKVGEGKGKEKEQGERGGRKGKKKDQEGKKEISNFEDWAKNNIGRLWSFYYRMLLDIERRKEDEEKKVQEWMKRNVVRFFFF